MQMCLRCRKAQADQSGQGTVEFALSLLISMGFVVFFFQLAMNFAVGNYIHYATFMSARAYQSAGPSEADQISRGRRVLARMVKRSESSEGIDRFGFIAKGEGGEDATLKGASVGRHPRFDKDTFNLSWLEGVRYTFRSKLTLIPLQGASESNSLVLTSESWLGREPSARECREAVIQSGGRVIDNGC